ncbi:endonuclease VII domain-containing protein [Porticoccus sp.]
MMAGLSGASRQSKHCKKCDTLKTREHFGVRQSGPREGHLSAYCKLCNSRRGSVARKRDPTLYLRVERPSKLKRMYGITVEDYDRMLSEQGGRCAICASDNTRTRRYGNMLKKDVAFSVDHCHRTGKVRGLLCSACNRVLGLIGDNPDIAQNIIKYLQRSNSIG